MSDEIQGPNTSKERPRSWNDDVIWLLERLVGLLGAAGRIGSAEIPLGGPSSPVIHYVRLTPTDVAASGEVIIQLPDTTPQWRLLSAQLHKTAGSSSTWAPRVGQVSGFTDDGPEDRLSLDPQSASEPFRLVFCQPIPMKADADGRLYLKPGFDAGADNDADIQLWFVQDFETQESS